MRMVSPETDFNGSGSLTERYLFGPGVVNGAVMSVILARTSSGGTTAWYLTDNLGSVRDIVSTSGTELDHIVYDSFGNIVTETDAANGDRFEFAGMQYDATTGQYYDHARWYEGQFGRFVVQDPKGFGAGDPNLYRYGGNRPMDATDPSGYEGSSVGPGTFSGMLGVLPFLWDAYWETAANGMQAKQLAVLGDGFVPFMDPLAKLGLYDPSESNAQIAQVVGGISRDALLTAAVPNLTVWMRSPIMYELGATTVPAWLWGQISTLSAIERGWLLWANY
jgi:RHS repeat-associated protein